MRSSPGTDSVPPPIASIGPGPSVPPPAGASRGDTLQRAQQQMHVEDDSDEIDLPTGNPFIRPGSSAIANMKSFFSEKVMPSIRSATASVKGAAKDRDLSKATGLGAKVVYFIRKVTFAVLTVLSDVSSGSADFFASLAKKVNPGEPVPQLADRFSSMAPGPPPSVDPSQTSDAPDTIVDP